MPVGTDCAQLGVKQLHKSAAFVGTRVIVDVEDQRGEVQIPNMTGCSVKIVC